MTKNIQLDFAGVTNGSLCSDCSNLNTSYIQPSLNTDCGASTPVGATGCCGSSQGSSPGACLNANFFRTARIYESGGSYYLDVLTQFNSSAPSFNQGWDFQKNFGASQPDCESFSGLDIPLVNDHSDIFCDGTVTLTATSV